MFRPIILSSRRLLLGGILIVSGAIMAAMGQSVRLNEIQSANNSTILDENGDTSDWIELFNPGAISVNLSGYGLSDTATNAFRWTFANATLAPGSHLLVFASGKDRQPGAGTPLAPTNVPGLRVWLRASDIATNDATQVRASGGQLYVKNWRDGSGSAWSAGQGADAQQPRLVAGSAAFNGVAALHFDGVDDQLLLPAPPASNSFCVIAVVRADGPHEIDTASPGGVGGVSGQKYLFGAQHGGDYGAGAGLSIGTNGASVYEHGSGYMPALAVGAGVGTGAAVVAMNYSNRQPALWIQGNLVSAGFTSSRTNVTAPMEIGLGAYGAFAGDVAEILVFERALTDAEMLGLQLHLATRYGFQLARLFHTNFKLDAAGEAVFLTRPDGTLADSLPAAVIPRDVSYGRLPDGGADLFFFESPTPGAANVGPGALENLDAPTFSMPGGFYSSAVNVALSTTNAGAVIRYTLDGSEPTTNSARYLAPISFSNRAGTPNDISMIPTAGGWQPPLGEVYKINVLRARAFKSNALSSDTRTASYAVDPLGRARYPLPVVSLATDRKNFFDPDIGIYVCGNAPGCNYAQSGDAWERPIHVEFIETNNAVAFAQESGVRMHGNTSFGFPVKALRLHPLNQKGGEPFRYRIFPDLPISEFNRLLLRPSGHDHYLTMMRDGLMQNLVRELGIDVQGYRPAVVFLNGEYWGIHNVQEAFEKDFFANHHPGVDPNAIDYLEGYSPGAFVYEGTSAAFDQLIAFLQTQNLAIGTNYDYVQTLMEVDNYRDFKVAETFYYRWDTGNQRVWRPNTPGGRYRWILFDCDVGYGGFWSQPAGAPWTFNMLAYNLEPNGPWMNFQPGNDHNSPLVTLQLRSLMANPDFKRDFINRCADLMNTTLSTSRMASFIDRMSAEIAGQMAEHCARWRAPADWLTWSNNVQDLRDFATYRPEYMRRQITNQFGLRGWVNVTLKVSDTNAGAIRISTLNVTASTNAPWTGAYFRDNAITFAALPAAGYRFKNWQGIFGPPATNATNTLLLTGNLTLTANFEAVPSTNPPVPAPFPLASRPYVLTAWSADSAAGSYPPNMIFLQTETNASSDPVLSAEFTNHWTLPYNRTSRSRILGLGDDGFSFLNTSDPQTDGGGYLGAAVLALDTRGVTNVLVSWRGGTVTANSRAYAIRLQYRLGATNAFSDVLDAHAAPVEYVRNATSGHQQMLGPVTLPSGLLQQPYVQLRWKYYFLAGASGSRDQLRIDDIVVAENVNPPSLIGGVALNSGVITCQFTASPGVPYAIDTSTNLLDWTFLSTATSSSNGVISVELTPQPGVPKQFIRLRWP